MHLKSIERKTERKKKQNNLEKECKIMARHDHTNQTWKKKNQNHNFNNLIEVNHINCTKLLLNAGTHFKKVLHFKMSRHLIFYFNNSMKKKKKSQNRIINCWMPCTLFREEDYLSISVLGPWWELLRKQKQLAVSLCQLQPLYRTWAVFESAKGPQYTELSQMRRVYGPHEGH